MHLLRYACPRCGQRHRIGLWREAKRCKACEQTMALVPGMFTGRLFQGLFVAGAVALGMALGHLRLSLGMLPYDMDQFVLDMVGFWMYAWLSRMVYFQFQSVKMGTQAVSLDLAPR
jgi:tRNA G26 N,N-dimethylase Trm1